MKKDEIKDEFLSSKEKEQDIKITMEEIEAEEKCNQTACDKITDEDIKASVDSINPDEGSMGSRG